jgi:hypothetical protein
LSRLAHLALACLVASSVAACVTITPISRVSAEVTPTPAPTPAPTEPGHGATKPPKPPKGSARPTDTPEPTAAPTLNADDPACFDDAYNLVGFAWHRRYEWYYNVASTPPQFDPNDVLAVIETSINNVTSEYNDCGRPDAISIEALYVRDTTRTPCTDFGDSLNVIGWGKIPTDLSPDTIAYTCPYNDATAGEINEADIVISTDVNWALSQDKCFFEELLEPTVTHEMGHVLGLGHVSETDHPDLTMSTESNGPCNDDEATLGLGDMLGLEKLYPPK